MNNILTLDNISKHYKKKSEDLLILENANFSLNRGEMVALVGPSGSGKSTFLHIAGLLDSFDSGNIVISEIQQTHLSERARTKFRNENIGFVYQFHHLLPEFSALENVIIPQLPLGRKWKEAENRAKILLDRVNLKTRMNHKPSEMSGGEQQRVAICRALANNPTVLLADEPTGNLDPKTSEIVFDLLSGLVKEEGLSTIIATHNLELARKMSRIITISEGKIKDL